jgi:hypothetical protein
MAAIPTVENEDARRPNRERESLVGERLPKATFVTRLQPSWLPARAARQLPDPQLSGWNLPPLVIRAFGAHCHERTIRAIRSSHAARSANAAVQE